MHCPSCAHLLFSNRCLLISPIIIMLIHSNSLVVIVAVLALSNLGTSFAAAYLAKDTSTSENAELTDKKTSESISTQTTTDTISFDRTFEAEDGQRRSLVAECDKYRNVDGEKVFDCNVEGSELTISQNACRKMMKQCQRGNTVSLTRTWPNGDESKYDVCPYRRGRISKNNRSILVNGEGRKLVFEATRRGHCRISGSAIEQEEFEPCMDGDDCASGLACVKLEAFVEECKWRCGLKRWGPTLMKKCKDECDFPSCQRVPLSRGE